MSRKQRRLALPIVVASLLLGLASWQVSADGAADLKQNMIINSDRQEVDLRTNEVLLIGNVDIEQGSIRMRAARVKVIRNPDGTFKRMIATGSPASYSQRLEDGSPVKAEGNTLDYLMLERTLVITGDAQISQQDNIMKGNVIRYNLAQEKLTAESNEKDAKDRVTTIFRPAEQSGQGN